MSTADKRFGIPAGAFFTAEFAETAERILFIVTVSALSAFSAVKFFCMIPFRLKNGCIYINSSGAKVYRVIRRDSLIKHYPANSFTAECAEAAERILLTVTVSALSAFSAVKFFFYR
jgi:hypothetical protein